MQIIPASMHALTIKSKRTMPGQQPAAGCPAKSCAASDAVTVRVSRQPSKVSLAGLKDRLMLTSAPLGAAVLGAGGSVKLKVTPVPLVKEQALEKMPACEASGVKQA